VDQAALKSAALTLQEALVRYETNDATAREFRKVMQPYIDAALGGNLRTPVQWQDIPGSYLFLEGPLGNYRDLEAAYATFKVEITGKRKWVSEVMKRVDPLP
jgi:hypothetical protein